MDSDQTFYSFFFRFERLKNHFSLNGFSFNITQHFELCSALMNTRIFKRELNEFLNFFQTLSSKLQSSGVINFTTEGDLKSNQIR